VLVSFYLPLFLHLLWYGTDKMTDYDDPTADDKDTSSSEAAALGDDSPPTNNELEDYATFIRREMPGMVRRELERLFEDEFRDVEERLRPRVAEIVLNLQPKLLGLYKQSQMPLSEYGPEQQQQQDDSDPMSHGSKRSETGTGSETTGWTPSSSAVSPPSRSATENSTQQTPSVAESARESSTDPTSSVNPETEALFANFVTVDHGLVPNIDSSNFNDSKTDEFRAMDHLQGIDTSDYWSFANADGSFIMNSETQIQQQQQQQQQGSYVVDMNWQQDFDDLLNPALFFNMGS